MKMLKAVSIVLLVTILLIAAVVVIVDALRDPERTEADEIAAEVLAKLPESASADEIAAMVVGKLPECASAEQVAALELGSTPITGSVSVVFPDCIRICPPEAMVTTTITATSTTALTATTTVTPTACKDIYFAPGEEKVIPKGFLIAGDVDVQDNGAWRALYDNKEKTGLIVVLSEATKVRALWGADASDCHTAENIKAGMLAAGCTGGCDTVSVVNWPN